MLDAFWPAAFAALFSSAALEGAAPEADISPTYAESAAIGGMSPDAKQEFSVRLGRFPASELGTLSVYAVVGGRRYAVSDGDLELGSFAGKTPVADAEAVFEVTGAASARIACRDRHAEAMVCVGHAEALVHESMHPPPGRGAIPLRIDIEFRASHRPVRVRPGRGEAMGTVIATIATPSGQYRLEAPGKWHEQTGERPRFGSAFTYLNVQGVGSGLLARTGRSGSWGFLREGARTTAVRDFTIDPLGPPRRGFRVVLEDGRRLEGEAVVKLETSGPMEGRRRPSATVVVRSDVGEMVGHLNDWNPGD